MYVDGICDTECPGDGDYSIDLETYDCCKF